ncbi:MAG TPA: hypothetical protein V6C72_07630, partial [Chroococcales cyanobacterium]
MLEFCYNQDWCLPGEIPRRVQDLFEAGKVAHAAETYQNYLGVNARASLANYVRTIGEHILPLVQTAPRISRIVKERIEDAQNDGIVALELRFAPQNHTAGGLSLTGVMEAVIAGISAGSMPVKLIVCALRHQS